MVQKFRKKPVVIEAIQYNNLNRMEIENFVGKKLPQELESVSIETKEGAMKAMVGDWVIKEPFPTGDRDFYPCKNDIFIHTYEPENAEVTTSSPTCSNTLVVGSACRHSWDKSDGIWQQGRPHIGIKGKWVRTCQSCGYKEYYSRGMFTGWFSAP